MVIARGECVNEERCWQHAVVFVWIKTDGIHEHICMDHRRADRWLARGAIYGSPPRDCNEPSRRCVGSLVGGFLFGSLLGFQYQRGLNLATIVVATVGAVVFLFLLDWFRGRDRLDDDRRGLR